MEVDLWNYQISLDEATAGVKLAWLLLRLGLADKCIGAEVYSGDNMNSKELSIMSDGNVWTTDCFDTQGTHIYNTIYTIWYTI